MVPVLWYTPRVPYATQPRNHPGNLYFFPSLQSSFGHRRECIDSLPNPVAHLCGSVLSTLRGTLLRRAQGTPRFAHICLVSTGHRTSCSECEPIAAALYLGSLLQVIDSE